MARERLASSRLPPVILGRRGSLLSGRPWVLLCCWLLAFLKASGGGNNNGGNPGHVRLWSVGADAADVTAALAQVPDENNLGRLARACSNYCHAGVDGLDLWMSLQEVCVTSSSRTFLEQMAMTREKGPVRRSSSLSHRSDAAAPPADSAIYATSRTAWPLLHSIFLCSVVSTFGLFAGFRMGSRVVSLPRAARLPLL